MKNWEKDYQELKERYYHLCDAVKEAQSLDMGDYTEIKTEDWERITDLVFN